MRVVFISGFFIRNVKCVYSTQIAKRSWKENLEKHDDDENYCFKQPHIAIESQTETATGGVS